MLRVLFEALERRARADEARGKKLLHGRDGSRPESVGRVPLYATQPLQRPMVRPGKALPKREFADSGSQGSGQEGRGKKVAAIVIRIIRGRGTL